MNSVITVKQLNKTFGKKQVLHNLDLEVPRGAMVALIGASGSGKSTFGICQDSCHSYINFKLLFLLLNHSPDLT